MALETDENDNLVEITEASEPTQEMRLAALEKRVVELEAALVQARKETQLQHGQFLMLLGDTFSRQGHGIVDNVSQLITEAKLVPKEEEHNENTMKVIKDGDTLTLYAVKEDALIPYENANLDKGVISQKLNEHGVTDGTMVNMNIYISRG